MRRTVVFVTAALFAAGVATSALAKGPFGSIHVGDWHGGAYTFDNTGAFSHCAAGGQYQNGVYLVVSQNAQNVWSIGFADQAFKLVVGETVPIDLTFDGNAEVRVFGTAISPIMFNALLPSSALNTFRRSQLMVAQAKGATFQFNLTSTDVLIPTIARCVSQTKAVGIQNVGSFSMAVANPPVAKQASPKPATEIAGPPKTALQNGTGFVVSARGDVVTNFHVVGNCVGDINGNLTGEAASKMRVVASDETNDLALLQVSKPFKDFAKIRATAVRSGDQIIAIGFPYHGLLTSDFTVTTGIVSSLSGLLNDTRYLQISAGVQPGNSGGPLLDTSGYVVGVVSEKINALKFAKATGDIPENINFAIKTGALRDFLDNSSIQYQTAEPKSELKAAEVAQSARAYTMLISCQGKVKD